MDGLRAHPDIICNIYQQLSLKYILICSAVARSWYKVFADIYQTYVNKYSKLINSHVTESTSIIIGTDTLVNVQVDVDNIVNHIRISKYDLCGNFMLITVPVDYYTTFSALCYGIFEVERYYVRCVHGANVFIWKCINEKISTTCICKRCLSMYAGMGICFEDAFTNVIKCILSDRISFNDCITKEECCDCTDV